MQQKIRKSIGILLSLLMLLSMFGGLTLTAGAASGGTCGENVTWTLDDDGLLTISGTGPMEDYTPTIWSPFKNNSEIKEIVIASGVTNIGNYAFFNCKNLTSATIGDSVETIGTYAFFNCRNLTSVTIGNSLESIGNHAFDSCSNLTSVTIPASVRNIDGYAFSGCYGLTEIVVDESNENYSSDEFGCLFNKDKTSLIQYPCGKNATGYLIPDSVTSVVKSAFNACCGLTIVTIPASVTSIGSYAFDECSDLTDVCYIGSAEEWSDIAIEKSNDPLTGANIHYACTVTVTPATCTEAGTRIISAPDDFEMTEVIAPATGHTYVNHEAKTPTCADVGWDAYRTCANCDYTEYEEIPSTGDHVWTEADWTDGYFADCGNDGMYGYYTCTVCGGRFDSDGTQFTDETIVIPATGNHDYEWTTDEEPGCYTDGVQHQVCSVCGDEQAWNTPIPAAHEFDAWVEAVPATCGSDGTVGYQRCHVCGDSFDADGEQLDSIVDPATGDHAYVNHDAKAPTCTDIGWNAYRTCANCDYTEYVELPANGHTYVNHDAKAPTCTEIGWDAYRTCENCDYTEYVELPANGHAYVNHDAKAPTCTEIGWEAYRTCENCDYTEYVEIPASGHTTTLVNAKEATAAEDGYTGDEVCAVCGQTIRTGEVIPATGEQTPDDPAAPTDGEKPHGEHCFCYNVSEDSSYGSLIHFLCGIICALITFLSALGVA